MSGKNYGTSFWVSWHRLLCHSLVHSEKLSSVDGKTKLTKVRRNEDPIKY